MKTKKYNSKDYNSILAFFKDNENEIVKFINNNIDIPILNERQEGFIILYIYRLLILAIKRFT